MGWSRSGAVEHRIVKRSRVILLAPEGLLAREIARRLKTRLARASKWRRRFSRDRLAGLQGAPRSGKLRRTTSKLRREFWLCWTAIRRRDTANGTADRWPNRWAM